MATQKEIAKHLLMSERRIADVLKKLELPTKGCDLDQARETYILHLREEAAGRSSEGEYDLVEERARLAHHQANKTALEEETLRGNLLPSDEVLDEWEKLISNFRARLLSMPTKAGHRLVNANNFGEIESIIKEHVYEALDELSNEPYQENSKSSCKGSEATH